MSAKKEKHGHHHHNKNKKPLHLSSSYSAITDTLYDVHNHLHKWDSASNEGFSLVSQASNIKLNLLGDLSGNKDSTSKEDNVICTYNEDLSVVCQKLTNTLCKLEEVVNGLQSISIKINKLCLLDETSRSFSSTNDDTVENYSLWPLSEINESICSISDMHSKQFQVNKEIVENIAHVDMFISNDEKSEDSDNSTDNCRDVLMTYTSIWLYQPYINASVKDEIHQNISLFLS